MAGEERGEYRWLDGSRLDQSWMVLASHQTGEGDRCVDVFARPDGTFGFEEFRKDPEDMGAWTPVSYFSGRAYSTEDDAVAGAVLLSFGSAGCWTSQFATPRRSGADLVTGDFGRNLPANARAANPEGVAMDGAGLDGARRRHHDTAGGSPDRPDLILSEAERRAVGEWMIDHADEVGVPRSPDHDRGDSDRRYLRVPTQGGRSYLYKFRSPPTKVATDQGD